MSSITISDLHPTTDANFIYELTAWEMSKIEGGRRRRRNENNSVGQINTATIIQQIDGTVDSMLKRIDDQTQLLQTQITGTANSTEV